MIGTLRQQLASPQLLGRLHQLAGNAPPSAPVSLRLDLGKQHTDCLHQLPEQTPFWYRALPARNEFRLGIGHAFQVSSAGANRFAALDNAFAGLCQHWRYEGQPLAFAGFAFDASSNGPLPNALLGVPAILLESIDGACAATLTIPAGRVEQAVGEWLQCLSRPARPRLIGMSGCHPEALVERAWIARVNNALRAIADCQVDKLVLARSRKIEAGHAFSPAHILGNLVDQQPGSLIYAHGNGQHTFLGATPERLVRLSGQQVDADALAGTAWPGSMALAEQKNQREQALVVHAVCAALAPLCIAPPEVSAAREHPAGQLRHLRSRISAKVKPGTSLFDLVRILHPTPAVGGFPVEAALAWLSDHQEQRHGWYSGGFGQLTPDGNGEFSVALRSALLDGKTAELQAGAGIVAGSIPRLELSETEAKLGTVLAALGPASIGDRNGTRHSR